MTDIIERLRFDAARCENGFSKGVAENIEAAIKEIANLRADLDASLARESELRRALDVVNVETIQTLLDLLNPLHGSLDKQLYDERMREQWEIPRDREWDDVTVLEGEERDLTQAVLILEDRKRQFAALSSPPSNLPDRQGDRDAVIEECAKAVEGFSWTLPVYANADLNEASDDTAEIVKEQIAAALRALKSPPADRGEDGWRVPKGWKLVPENLPDDLRDQLEYSLIEGDVGTWWQELLKLCPLPPPPSHAQGEENS